MTKRPTSDGGPSDDQSNRPSQLTYEIDDDECPSEAVVRAVTAFTDSSLVDLEPLYSVMDPVNLDEMFERTADSPVETALTFAFSGCAVRVTADAVYVSDPDEADDVRAGCW